MGGCYAELVLVCIPGGIDDDTVLSTSVFTAVWRSCVVYGPLGLGTEFTVGDLDPSP